MGTTIHHTDTLESFRNITGIWYWFFIGDVTTGSLRANQSLPSANKPFALRVVCHDEERGCGTDDWPGGGMRRRDQMEKVLGGWGGECFTAVSLDFCTTHQNSAACRQELGGRADTRSVQECRTASSYYYYPSFCYQTACSSVFTFISTH